MSYYDEDFPDVSEDVMEIVERLEEILNNEYEEDYQPLDFEDED